MQFELVAQSYGLAYALVFLCLFLGLLLIGVPRPRAQYQTAQEKISGRMKKIQRKRPSVQPKTMSTSPQSALSQQRAAQQQSARQQQSGQRPGPPQRPAQQRPPQSQKPTNK